MRQKGFVLLPVIIVIFLIGIVTYFIYHDNVKKGSFPKPTPENSPQPILSPEPTSRYNMKVIDDNVFIEYLNNEVNSEWKGWRTWFADEECDWQPKMMPYKWYWENDVIVGGVSYVVGQNLKNSCLLSVGDGYPSEPDNIYFIKKEGVWKIVNKGDAELCKILESAPKDYTVHQGGPECVIK